MNPGVPLLLATALGTLAALECLWGLGLPWAREASIPWTRRNGILVKASARASLAVAFGLALAAASVAATYDPWLKAQSLRFMALIFSLRAIGDFRETGLFNSVRGTRFAYWDSRVYSPVGAALALLALLSSFA